MDQPNDHDQGQGNSSKEPFWLFGHHHHHHHRPGSTRLPSVDSGNTGRMAETVPPSCNESRSSSISTFFDGITQHDLNQAFRHHNHHQPSQQLPDSDSAYSQSLSDFEADSGTSPASSSKDAKKKRGLFKRILRNKTPSHLVSGSATPLPGDLSQSHLQLPQPGFHKGSVSEASSQSTLSRPSSPIPHETPPDFSTTPTPPPPPPLPPPVPGSGSARSISRSRSGTTDTRASSFLNLASRGAHGSVGDKPAKLTLNLSDDTKSIDGSTKKHKQAFSLKPTMSSINLHRHGKKSLHSDQSSLSLGESQSASDQSNRSPRQHHHHHHLAGRRPRNIITGLHKAPEKASPQTDLDDLYHLDTDLAHMGGIIDTGDKDHHQQQQQQPPMLAETRSTTPGYGQDNAWQAPESWAVKPIEDYSDNDGLISIGRTQTLPARGFSSPALNRMGTNASHNIAESKPLSSWIRIIKSDDRSFINVPCAEDVSVIEILRVLFRKLLSRSSHTSMADVRLCLKYGGHMKLLRKSEHPVKTQERILKLAGYIREDDLTALAREDFEFLYRFEFFPCLIDSMYFKAPHISFNGEPYVDLSGLELLTIPIGLYSYADKVKALNLSYNYSIRIPLDFIQSCIHLEHLIFCNNKFGSVPANINRIDTLNHLDLAGNELSDLTDSHLDDLVNLAYLSLFNNRLSFLPESFHSFSHLSELYLGFNNFESIPGVIAQLDSLRVLNLSYNSISEIDESVLFECTKLEHLDLCHNKLSGELPSCFSGLESLQQLDLQYNQLSSVHHASKLHYLEELDVSHNAISTFDCELENLVKLNLSFNPLFKFVISKDCPKLIFLNMSHAKINTLEEIDFGKMANLEALRLDFNGIDILPESMTALQRLVILKCANNKLKHIRDEIGDLTSLELLDVHCNQLTALPQGIWRLSNLLVLNASSNCLTVFPSPETALPENHAANGLAPTAQDFQFKELERRPSQYSLWSASPKTSFSRRHSSIRGTGNVSPHNQRVARSPPPHRTISPRSSFVRDLIPGRASVEPDRNSSESSSRPALARSLFELYLANNRLGDNCFDCFNYFSELRTLNISYNHFSQCGLRNLHYLRELYLSGNKISNALDHLDTLSRLEVLFINKNRMRSLPAEIGTLFHLHALDAGCNILKYNVCNWPYEYNWNFNKELEFLNLSGNQRLVISSQSPIVPDLRTTSDVRSSVRRETNGNNLINFTGLGHLRVLGLVDVTFLGSQYPDESDDCRVRFSQESDAEINAVYGVADKLGETEHIANLDAVISKFRGDPDENIFALFAGTPLRNGGSSLLRKLRNKVRGQLSMEMASKRGLATVEDALRRTFLAINKTIANYRGDLADDEFDFLGISSEEQQAGCSATLAYLKDKKLYTANVGTAMAIMIKKDGSFTQLTRKHAPSEEEELERLRTIGAYVGSDGSLNGDSKVDVSRAFGYYQQLPYIIAVPHTSEYDVQDDDEMLIIANERLWDYLTMEQVANLVLEDNNEFADQASNPADPLSVAERLRDFAIAYGCTDALTVIAVGVTGSHIRKRGFYVEDSAFHNDRGHKVVPATVDDQLLLRYGPEPPAPVGKLAMVFTDIKNSTVLWESIQGTMQSAMSIHNNLMRQLLRTIGGYEIKTEGDAFMVCFQSVIRAMYWCYMVQIKLVEADWPPEVLLCEDGAVRYDPNGRLLYRGLCVRMGIHFGMPVCEPDPVTRRMDYFGPMVNRSSRVSSIAKGGQISVSKDVLNELNRIRSAIHEVDTDHAPITKYFESDSEFDLAKHDLAKLDNIGIALRTLGSRKLKGVSDEVEVFLTDPAPLKARLDDDEGSSSKWIKELRDIVSNDSLLNLHYLAGRLETICSILNEDEDQPPPPFLGFEHRRDLYAAGFSDADVLLLPQFEHCVTRIENAVATLQMRSMMQRLNGQDYKGQRIPRMDLSKLLDSLSTVMKDAKLSTASTLPGPE